MSNTLSKPLTSALMRLLLIAAVTVGVTLVAWLLGADPLTAGHVTGNAKAAIHPWRWGLMLARWAFWGLLWYRWAWIGTRLFRGDTERAQWQAMRPRMLGGIAVVEGIILFSVVTGG